MSESLPPPGTDRVAPRTRAGGPLAAPKPRRWWHAALVILIGYALAAVPAFFLLMIAAFGFSGCFLECSEPDPAQGWLGVAGMVLVLSAPIVAGVAFLKRNRIVWVAMAVLLAGAFFAVV